MWMGLGLLCVTGPSHLSSYPGLLVSLAPGWVDWHTANENHCFLIHICTWITTGRELIEEKVLFQKLIGESFFFGKPWFIYILLVPCSHKTCIKVVWENSLIIITDRLLLSFCYTLIKFKCMLCCMIFNPNYKILPLPYCFAQRFGVLSPTYGMTPKLRKFYVAKCVLENICRTVLFRMHLIKHGKPCHFYSAI